MGHTYTEVANLGARWSRFLTVTLMMVRVLVYGSYLYRGGKSGCKMVTLFDSYSYDGVSAGIYWSYLYRGGKSGCKMVMLFDSYSYDGVSAGIWVILIQRWQIWVQDGHAF